MANSVREKWLGTCRLQTQDLKSQLLVHVNLNTATILALIYGTF